MTPRLYLALNRSIPLRLKMSNRSSRIIFFIFAFGLQIARIERCWADHCDRPMFDDTLINISPDYPTMYGLYEVIEFSCVEGGLLAGGPDRLTCNPSKLWAVPGLREYDHSNFSQSLQCLGPCQLNSVDNDVFYDRTTTEYGDDTLASHGEVVMFSCDGTLIGNNELTCSNTVWSDAFPTCLSECRVEELEEYQRSNTTSNITIAHEETYTICGLQPIQVTCDDGTWLGDTKCPLLPTTDVTTTQVSSTDVSTTQVSSTDVTTTERSNTDLTTTTGPTETSTITSTSVTETTERPSPTDSLTSKQTTTSITTTTPSTSTSVTVQYMEESSTLVTIISKEPTTESKSTTAEIPSMVTTGSTTPAVTPDSTITTASTARSSSSIATIVTTTQPSTTESTTVHVTTTEEAPTMDVRTTEMSSTDVRTTESSKSKVATATGLTETTMSKQTIHVHATTPPTVTSVNARTMEESSPLVTIINKLPTSKSKSTTTEIPSVTTKGSTTPVVTQDSTITTASPVDRSFLTVLIVLLAVIVVFVLLACFLAWVNNHPIGPRRGFDLQTSDTKTSVEVLGVSEKEENPEDGKPFEIEIDEDDGLVIATTEEASHVLGESIDNPAYEATDVESAHEMGSLSAPGETSRDVSMTDPTYAQPDAIEGGPPGDLNDADEDTATARKRYAIYASPIPKSERKPSQKDSAKKEEEEPAGDSQSEGLDDLESTMANFPSDGARRLSAMFEEEATTL